ncbi:MAG: hypothetical protein GTO17_12520 [Candidatus Aminicenantes bacterium]|nr:hypothetical protein [Candidatus Aminicenantes bacterium]
MSQQKPSLPTRDKKGKGFFFLLFLILSILSGTAAFSRKYLKIFLPDGSSLTAELALTDKERQEGLMFREKIDWDQGMLFVFKREGIHSFWMKNMRFPIDILWLDREKRIVHLEIDVPPCTKDPCPSYSTSNSALFVLELKAGSVARHRLKLYDKIEFVLPELKD